MHACANYCGRGPKSIPRPVAPELYLTRGHAERLQGCVYSYDCHLLLLSLQSFTSRVRCYLQQFDISIGSAGSLALHTKVVARSKEVFISSGIKSDRCTIFSARNREKLGSFEDRVVARMPSPRKSGRLWFSGPMQVSLSTTNMNDCRWFVHISTLFVCLASVVLQSNHQIAVS